MKHCNYNSSTAHLMVDCFPLIRSEFRLTVSSFLSYFLKRVSNFFRVFLPRIFCLFCCYVTVFKDYFLLRHLFKYDSNSVSKFIIIFILSADKQRRKNAKVTNTWCYLLRFL